MSLSYNLNQTLNKAELEYCWEHCRSDSKSDSGTDFAWLSYFYFQLLSPLTDNNSEVGLALTLGMMLSMHKQAKFRHKELPVGTILQMEILKV